MKKSLSISVLIFLLALALSGCGSTDLPEALAGSWTCEPLASDGKTATEFYAMDINTDGSFSPIFMRKDDINIFHRNLCCSVEHSVCITYVRSASESNRRVAEILAAFSFDMSAAEIDLIAHCFDAAADACAAVGFGIDIAAGNCDIVSDGIRAAADTCAAVSASCIYSASGDFNVVCPDKLTAANARAAGHAFSGDSTACNFNIGNAEVFRFIFRIHSAAADSRAAAAGLGIDRSAIDSYALCALRETTADGAGASSQGYGLFQTIYDHDRQALYFLEGGACFLVQKGLR